MKTARGRRKRRLKRLRVPLLCWIKSRNVHNLLHGWTQDGNHPRINKRGPRSWRGKRLRQFYEVINQELKKVHNVQNLTIGAPDDLVSSGTLSGQASLKKGCLFLDARTHIDEKIRAHLKGQGYIGGSPNKSTCASIRAFFFSAGVPDAG